MIFSLFFLSHFSLLASRFLFYTPSLQTHSLSLSISLSIRALLVRWSDNTVQMKGWQTFIYLALLIHLCHWTLTGPALPVMFCELRFIHHCHCLLQDGKTAEDLAIAEQQEHVAVLLAKLKKVWLFVYYSSHWDSRDVHLHYMNALRLLRALLYFTWHLQEMFVLLNNDSHPSEMYADFDYHFNPLICFWFEWYWVTGLESF